MASAYLSYVAPAPAPVKMIRRSSLVHASSSRLNNRTNMPRLMCSPGGHTCAMDLQLMVHMYVYVQMIKVV